MDVYMFDFHEITEATSFIMFFIFYWGIEMFSFLFYSVFENAIYSYTRLWSNTILISSFKFLPYLHYHFLSQHYVLSTIFSPNIRSVFVNGEFMYAAELSCLLANTALLQASTPPYTSTFPPLSRMVSKPCKEWCDKHSHLELSTP